MTKELKNKIQRILNYVETGSQQGNYGLISIFDDGPNGIKQITYGRSQTTEFGNLRSLVDFYIKNNGKLSVQLIPYLDSLGRRSLVKDEKFIDLLKEAAEDPIMIKTQDEFFDLFYWKRAESFFNSNGFKLPLSMLVIYDSYIHSGRILTFLRKAFAEVPPSAGGNEKKWIEEYLKARHTWLRNHPNFALVKSSYRTRDMLRAITEENWMLDKKYFCNGEEIY
jgi:chitosanase